LGDEIGKNVVVDFMRGWVGGLRVEEEWAEVAAAVYESS
jgi:hypothetical protein